MYDKRLERVGLDSPSQLRAHSQNGNANLLGQGGGKVLVRVETRSVLIVIKKQN